MMIFILDFSGRFNKNSYFVVKMSVGWHINLNFQWLIIYL